MRRLCAFVKVRRARDRAGCRRSGSVRTGRNYVRSRHRFIVAAVIIHEQHSSVRWRCRRTPVHPALRCTLSTQALSTALAVAQSPSLVAW